MEYQQHFMIHSYKELILSSIANGGHDQDANEELESFHILADVSDVASSFVE
jgi:hypothetical protein